MITLKFSGTKAPLRIRDLCRGDTFTYADAGHNVLLCDGTPIVLMLGERQTGDCEASTIVLTGKRAGCVQRSSMDTRVLRVDLDITATIKE